MAQKAVEAGIKEIVPVISKRAVKLNLNLKRLNKIIREAAEQSERGIMPILNKPLELSKAIKESQSNNLNLFFDRNGSEFSEVLGIIKKDDLKKIGIWIGPEGGWGEEEVKIAKENNFKIVSLGKLTLRAETAAIIASYLIENSR